MRKLQAGLMLGPLTGLLLAPGTAAAQSLDASQIVIEDGMQVHCYLERFWLQINMQQSSNNPNDIGIVYSHNALRDPTADWVTYSQRIQSFSYDIADGRIAFSWEWLPPRENTPGFTEINLSLGSCRFIN